MQPRIPDRIDRLLALACREPGALRRMLARNPSLTERRRLEFALSLAEAKRRDHESLAANIEHPARMQAMVRFWHDLTPPPERGQH